MASSHAAPTKLIRDGVLIIIETPLVVFKFYDLKAYSGHRQATTS
jgi:hypothetical protein